MFTHLIFDTNNFAYQVFNSPEISQTNIEEIIKFSEKKVYKNFISNMIETVAYIQKKFLVEGGETIFLFDNHTSRQDLEKMLQPLPESSHRKKIYASYKEDRKKEKQEFYNSIDLIRYWSLIQNNSYHSARITNLEADDLVFPCIEYLGKDAQILLITNDQDWARYLNKNVNYLPELYKEPKDVYSYEQKYGYYPTKDRVILDKVINGDTSDKVKAVFPEFNKELRKFIIDKFESVFDFLFRSHEVEETKPFHKLILERMEHIKITYQVLSAIPVTSKHFKAIYTTGRDSNPLLCSFLKTISTPYYPSGDCKTAKGGFKFGLKIPRREPTI